MKFRYRFLDESGDLVFCNLCERDIDILPSITEVSKVFGKTRCGSIDLGRGVAYLFSDEKDFIKSSKKFKALILTIYEWIDYLKFSRDKVRDDGQKRIQRLIHNLTSLNAHNIQELHSVFPQEIVARNMGDQIKEMERIIRLDPREAASVVLRIAKNNIAMKTEFSVFKRFYEMDSVLRFQSHIVHKVIMNVLYIFFSDFTDKKVRVNLAPSDEVAYFDYETIHVALYHIVENSAKYCKPSSEVSVSIERGENGVVVEFDMYSLVIHDDEVDKLFDEGFSGKIAIRLNKSGYGIGTNIIKRMLEMNYGEVSVERFPDTETNFMGIPYQRNIFRIVMPRKRTKYSRMGDAP